MAVSICMLGTGLLQKSSDHVTPVANHKRYIWVGYTLLKLYNIWIGIRLTIEENAALPPVMMVPYCAVGI